MSRPARGIRRNLQLTVESSSISPIEGGRTLGPPPRTWRSARGSHSGSAAFGTRRPVPQEQHHDHAPGRKKTLNVGYPEASSSQRSVAPHHADPGLSRLVLPRWILIPDAPDGCLSPSTSFLAGTFYEGDLNQKSAGRCMSPRPIAANVGGASEERGEPRRGRVEAHDHPRRIRERHLLFAQILTAPHEEAAGRRARGDEPGHRRQPTFSV